MGNAISDYTTYQILYYVHILSWVYLMEWNETEYITIEQDTQACQFAFTSQKF